MYHPRPSGSRRAAVSVFVDGVSGMGAANVRNLPHQVATAVAFGFPREKALAAMTLDPARILGVDGRLGSLVPGKDARLFLADGDLSDKQKRLYERYRNRPKPR